MWPQQGQETYVKEDGTTDWAAKAAQWARQRQLMDQQQLQYQQQYYSQQQKNQLSYAQNPNVFAQSFHPPQFLPLPQHQTPLPVLTRHLLPQNSLLYSHNFPPRPHYHSYPQHPISPQHSLSSQQSIPPSQHPILPSQHLISPRLPSQHPIPPHLPSQHPIPPHLPSQYPVTPHHPISSHISSQHLVPPQCVNPHQHSNSQDPQSSNRQHFHTSPLYQKSSSEDCGLEESSLKNVKDEGNNKQGYKETSIPGLDLIDDSIKRKNVDNEGPSVVENTDQMIESLGKIVTQLQALKKVESKTEEYDYQQKECDDTNRKVAALLENESDSDDESNGQNRYSENVTFEARDFDGYIFPKQLSNSPSFLTHGNDSERSLSPYRYNQPSSHYNYEHSSYYNTTDQCSGFEGNKQYYRSSEYEYGHSHSVVDKMQSVDYEHGQKGLVPAYDDAGIVEQRKLSSKSYPELYYQPASLPSSVNYALTQLQQKGLPKWLKEELEQREKRKVKETEYSPKTELNDSNKRKWIDELKDDEKESVTNRKRKYSHLKVDYLDDISKDDSDEGDNYKEDMIYQVRQLLTSILLEVTSAEIHTLVNEVLMEFTDLTKHSVTNTVNNPLGLHIYESDSDHDDSIINLKSSEGTCTMLCTNAESNESVIIKSDSNIINEISSKHYCTSPEKKTKAFKSRRSEKKKSLLRHDSGDKDHYSKGHEGLHSRTHTQSPLQDRHRRHHHHRHHQHKRSLSPKRH